MEVQAGSSARVNQQIATKTSRAGGSFTQEQLSPVCFTIYMGLMVCDLQLWAQGGEEEEEARSSSS